MAEKCVDKMLLKKINVMVCNNAYKFFIRKHFRSFFEAYHLPLWATLCRSSCSVVTNFGNSYIKQESKIYM